MEENTGRRMWQAGIIAVSGIIALEKMVDRLRDDHKNTRVLSEKLTKMERISISLQTVKAKILISNIFGPKMTASEFV
jgi:threonine aldolase